MKILHENVTLCDIDPSKLTSDCHTVIRKDGIVDIVRSHKMADIFDFYHDRKIRLQRIELSGGTRNPKLQSPE
jgi:hypothetical protein